MLQGLEPRRLSHRLPFRAQGPALEDGSREDAPEGTSQSTTSPACLPPVMLSFPDRLEILLYYIYKMR